MRGFSKIKTYIKPAFLAAAIGITTFVGGGIVYAQEDDVVKGFGSEEEAAKRLKEIKKEKAEEAKRAAEKSRKERLARERRQRELRERNDRLSREIATREREAREREARNRAARDRAKRERAARERAKRAKKTPSRSYSSPSSKSSSFNPKTPDSDLFSLIDLKRMLSGKLNIEAGALETRGDLDFNATIPIDNNSSFILDLVLGSNYRTMYKNIQDDTGIVWEHTGIEVLGNVAALKQITSKKKKSGQKILRGLYFGVRLGADYFNYLDASISESYSDGYGALEAWLIGDDNVQITASVGYRIRDKKRKTGFVGYREQSIDTKINAYLPLEDDDNHLLFPIWFNLYYIDADFKYSNGATAKSWECGFSAKGGIAFEIGKDITLLLGPEFEAMHLKTRFDGIASKEYFIKIGVLAKLAFENFVLSAGLAYNFRKIDYNVLNKDIKEAKGYIEAKVKF